MDQYIGRMLDNRYELLELIGKGGMANVYKAKCHRLNRMVAVKILKSDLADSEEFRRRFHDESLAVAQLSHVNIVSVYDVSRSEELDYIVMELIDGITLKQYMERRGKMDWREALHFIIQIMRGLSHAHSRGIIHRDIKPQNIMVLRDGSVKVADFGIACLADSQTLTQEALGSVHYISPEQARGDRPDARSDIYSAGVVLYEMLTGRLPFEGDSAVSVAIQHLSSVPLTPRELNPDVPEALELITMKAMSPSLEKRYPSADAMLEDLEAFRQDPNVDMMYIRAQLDESDEEGEPTQPIPVLDNHSKDNQSEKKSSIGEIWQEKKGVFFLLGGIICALIAIALIFLGINKGMKNQGSGPDYYLVPDLTGCTIEEAMERDDIKDIFEIRQGGGRYNDKFQPGQIVEQSPAPNLKRSAHGQLVITVYVCVEEELPLMPYLTGYGFQESKAKLMNLNWELEIHEEKQFSDDVPAGQVIRTEPSANEPLLKGSFVLLITSSGPEIKPVQVISFLDQSFQDAVSQAENLGLKVGDPLYQYSDKPNGTVIAQSIPVSDTVEEGSTIVFTVSKVVTIGKYIGVNYNDAYNAAKTAGLDVRFDFVFSEEEKDTVIKQSLAEKEQVAEGTVIILTVSKGEEERFYSVIYQDIDGTVYGRTDNLRAGDPMPSVQNPSKEGFVFAGWSPQVASTVTSDTVYTAQWTAIEPDPTPDPEPGGEGGN